MKVKNTISNEGDHACKDVFVTFWYRKYLYFCKLMVPPLTIDDAGLEIFKGNKIWFILESK